MSEGWHVSLNILASCYKLDPNGWFAAVTNDTNELIGKSSGLLTSHFNCIVQQCQAQLRLAGLSEHVHFRSNVNDVHITSLHRLQVL